ncbi:hypothetical protein PR048_030324, partial [Dryococelus australis]
MKRGEDGAVAECKDGKKREDPHGKRPADATSATFSNTTAVLEEVHMEVMMIVVDLTLPCSSALWLLLQTSQPLRYGQTRETLYLRGYRDNNRQREVRRGARRQRDAVRTSARGRPSKVGPREVCTGDRRCRYVEKTSPSATRTKTIDSERQYQTVSPDLVLIRFSGLPPTMVANLRTYSRHNVVCLASNMDRRRSPISSALIPSHLCSIHHLVGAMVGERLARSPPTKVNRVQSPGVSLEFRKSDSCRMVPLVGGFSRGSPVSSARSFRRRSIFTSITLIGSQDLAVKSHPNLFTDSLTLQRITSFEQTSDEVIDDGTALDGPSEEVDDIPEDTDDYTAVGDPSEEVDGAFGVIPEEVDGDPTVVMPPEEVDDTAGTTPKAVDSFVGIMVTTYTIPVCKLCDIMLKLNQSYHMVASHKDEPGSIPGRATPGILQVGVVPDGAADRQVFSVFFRFPCHCILALLHSHLISLSMDLKTTLTLKCAYNRVLKANARLRNEPQLGMWRGDGVVARLNREWTSLFRPRRSGFDCQWGLSLILNAPGWRFSRGYPVSQSFRFGTAPYPPRLTFIGSQDLVVERRTNISTPQGGTPRALLRGAVRYTRAESFVSAEREGRGSNELHVDTVDTVTAGKPGNSHCLKEDSEKTCFKTLQLRTNNSNFWTRLSDTVCRYITRAVTHPGGTASYSRIALNGMLAPQRRVEGHCACKSDIIYSHTTAIQSASFLRDLGIYRFPPAPYHCGAAPYSPHITIAGSEDLAVGS